MNFSKAQKMILYSIISTLSRLRKKFFKMENLNLILKILQKNLLKKILKKIPNKILKKIPLFKNKKKMQLNNFLVVQEKKCNV